MRGSPPGESDDRTDFIDMHYQWLVACAAVVIVLLAASPFVVKDGPAPGAVTEVQADGQASPPPESAAPVTVSEVDARAPSSAPAAGDTTDQTEWARARRESAEAMGALGDATRESAAEAWEATKSGSRKAWEATKSGSRKAWEATRSGAGEAAEATGETTSKAWEATKSTTREIWDSVKEATADMVESAPPDDKPPGSDEPGS